MIRPFSLLVVGQLNDHAAATFRKLNDSGLQGLATQCPTFADEAQFAIWARAVVEAAKKSTRSVLFYRTPSMAHARVAAKLGVTHVSLRTAA